MSAQQEIEQLAKRRWPQADQIDLVQTDMILTGAVNRIDTTYWLIAWQHRERWILWPIWKRSGLERIGSVSGKTAEDVATKLKTLEASDGRN